MRRIPWQLAVGLAIVAVWIALGVAAPLLTRTNPLRTITFIQEGTRSIPPPFDPGTYGFPLGSDRQGRDLWVNLMYGARVTLTIVAIVLAARFAVGVVLGSLAGWYAGRTVDRVVSVLIDAFASFPTILFAVLWIFALDIRSGLSAFAAALAITGWWGFGRATRAAVVDLRARPFLEAARAGGLSDLAIFARHAVPNLAPTLAVAAALEASAIVLVLGELGFIGFVVGGGTQIPLDDRTGGTVFFFNTPEWGAILAQGRFELFNAPWIALAPALAFASAVLAFNLAGHGLRTVLDRSPVAFHRVFSWKVVAPAVALLVALRLVSGLVEPAAAFVPAARAFDAVRAKAHVDFLADPARGGRLPGSAGFDEAAAYVAERFREIGLEPLGDRGTYFQEVTMPLVGITAMPGLERLGEAPKRFVPRVDFTEGVGGRRGGGSAEGNVVFVGGGIRTAEYSDYAGVSAEGNVVLIAGPTQPGTDPVDTAIRAGAKAVIFVREPVIRFSYIPAFEQDTVPVIFVSERVADELIAPSGKRIADLRKALEDRRRREQTRPTIVRRVPEPLSFDTPTRVRVSVPVGEVRQVRSANVVGVLRGSDAERSKRYVVIGGHLDGIGADPDGTVFPGANDNASGVAVAIEVARALARERATLKNSVIVAAFTGEESGLLGSAAFVDRSITTVYRPDNVAAFLNIDVAGCCGSELGASEESFPLRSRVAAAAERVGVDIGFATGSSDHLSYARRRVPAAMISWVESEHIHTSRDTADRIEPWRLRAAGEVTVQTVLELAAGG